MRATTLLLLAACAALLATGCTTATKGNVLEAERMKLKDCSAKGLPGASAGKAVLMEKDTSEATGVIDLAKGDYDVVVYMQGAATDEDAVYVTVAGGEKRRIYGEPHGEIVAAVDMATEDRSFPVTIKMDGPCEVLLTTAETNVYVDRIEFTRKP